MGRNIMGSSEKTIPEINAQYIIDKSGKKTGVILDINTFERLLEEIEEFYFGKMAECVMEKEKDQKKYTLDEVKDEIVDHE